MMRFFSYSFIKEKETKARKVINFPIRASYFEHISCLISLYAAVGISVIASVHTMWRYSKKFSSNP